MTVLVLATAVVALIWGGVFLRYAGLWGLCIATLVAGTVFGHSFFHVSLLTLDRALLAVACGLYVCQRRLGMADLKPWNHLDSLAAALLGLLFFSTLVHDWHIEGMLPMSRLVFFFVAPAILYWLARQTNITPARLRWMFGGFAILGLYLAVTALAERYGIRAAVFPRYIMDSPYREFFGRGRGPLLNPCGNGILMTLGMCCLLMFFPKSNRIGKLALLGLTAVYLAGIYATLTRSVWVGAALALLILLAVALPRQWRLPSLAAACVLAALVAGANWQRLQAFKRDKHVSVAEMRDSASLRPILATVAWKMFQDRPVLGVGYGHYRQHSVNYLGDRSVALPLEKVRPYIQHNVFLSLLTEVGLLGAGLFVALLAGWGHAAWRLGRSKEAPEAGRQLAVLFLCTLAAYVFNGLFHEVSIIPMVHMYLFFLAGAVHSISAAIEPPAA